LCKFKNLAEFLCRFLGLLFVQEKKLIEFLCKFFFLVQVL